LSEEEGGTVTTTAQEVSRLLGRVVAFDDLEDKHLTAVFTWLDSTDDVFRRAKPATPSPHLVSYFVPVDAATGQILLVEHRKSGLWLPPGGHVEPGEHPWDAVVRECHEELSLQAEPLFAGDTSPLFVTRTPTVEANPHIDVSLWYVIKADSTIEPDWDRGEFASVRWWPMAALAQADDRFDPHTPRFIAKLNARAA
jgi:8-oxo-dGTP pyrophosphatase MutT (NUDIX family)